MSAFRAGWFGVVVLAACGSADVRPSPAIGPAAPTSSAAPEPERARDLVALVRPLLEEGVEIHAGPLEVRSGVVVAWIGRGRATHGRLVVDAEGARVVPLPLASRAIAAFSLDGRALAILESLAALDQPAGLRALDAEPALESPLSRQERLWLSHEHADADAARALLAARRPRLELGKLPERAAFLRELAGGLLSVLSPRGVEVIRLHQETFGEPLRHLDARAFTALFPGDATLACATDGSCCEGDACSFTDQHGRVFDLLVERDDGHLRVARAFVSDDVPVIAADARPRLVEKEKNPRATAAAAARLLVGGTLLAEASLGKRGAVGVYRAPGDKIVVVEDEGDFARAFELSAFTLALDKLEVAFADVDGDGRTDVVLGGPPSATFVSVGPPDARAHQVYLSPHALAPPTEVPPDEASAIFLVGVRSMRDALSTLATLPVGPVRLSEACPLLAQIRALATAPRALSKGARLVTFREPGALALSGRAAPLREVVAAPGWSKCEEVTCDLSRPLCAFRYPPGLDAWVFGRDAKGARKIDAIVRYTGS